MLLQSEVSYLGLGPMLSHPDTNLVSLEGTFFQMSSSVLASASEWVKALLNKCNSADETTIVTNISEYHLSLLCQYVCTGMIAVKPEEYEDVMSAFSCMCLNRKDLVVEKISASDCAVFEEQRRVILSTKKDAYRRSPNVDMPNVQCKTEIKVEEQSDQDQMSESESEDMMDTEFGGSNGNEGLPHQLDTNSIGSTDGEKVKVEKQSLENFVLQLQPKRKMMKAKRIHKNKEATYLQVKNKGGRPKGFKPPHKSKSMCSQCKNSFVKMESHLKNCPKNKKVCNQCGKTVVDIESHMKNHEKLGEFPCEKCGSIFHSKATLISHVNDKHSDKPLPICDLCGMTVTRNRMKKHIMIHHTKPEDRPHKCSICIPVKGFAIKRLYDEHMNTHTGEKPYKCKLCKGAAFASQGNLGAHIRSAHKGIKRATK